MCREYLNHKYLYQGYSMDILFQSTRGPCRLGSLAAPSGLGRHGPFCTTFATVMRYSSVSATDRPPRRGLPRPNCHNHWLMTVDLIHVDSLPGMVGVQLPRRKRGIKGTRPQHIGGEVHIENGRGRGLVQLLHAHSFHRAAPGQDHGL